VQHWLNQSAIERFAAEMFAGPRARVYFLAFIALALAAAAGLAIAAVWLGLTLLAEEVRRALAIRVPDLPRRERETATLALAIVESTLMTAAPAIAWYARADLGPPLAIAMLCVLLAHAAQNSKLGRRATVAACSPYAVLGLLFVLEGAAMDALWPAALAMAGAGYVFAAALHHAHQAKHQRMLDGECVRQMNMAHAEPGAAAWEIDFTSRRVSGADKLAGLIGRAIDFDKALTHDLHAAPQDRALVRAMFAPGPSRNVVIEHDVAGPDGVARRVRHRGFLRTAPDGAPLRFTCTTRLAADEALFGALLAEAERVMAEQSRALADLRGAAPAASAPRAPPVRGLSFR
jgi:hypothetical protein